jgi:aminoglycoside phosphotransferase (APT) family kinase protein
VADADRPDAVGGRPGGVSGGPDGRAGIDADLVRRLIADQFPRWAHLPVIPVEVDGWDNRTYRLGDEMTVRLPTHESYARAVDKEYRWLPVLAPRLPVPVPVPLATGRPGQGYPHHWSIRRWIDGETAAPDRVGSLSEFGKAVAGFILALQAIDATDGPRPGAHSFYRGAPPAHYDEETRRAIATLGDRIDGRRASAVWDAALATTWHGPPRWFHGDVASGNLLVRDGTLAGVIDFGTSGVGDPACDLVIAWTFFDGASREVFRRSVDQDAGTWARARGWALWKSLIVLAGDIDGPTAAAHRRVIDEVLAEAATTIRP